jgi:hypothetical protein
MSGRAVLSPLRLAHSATVLRSPWNSTTVPGSSGGAGPYATEG